MILLQGRITNNSLYLGLCFVINLAMSVLFKKLTYSIDIMVLRIQLEKQVHEVFIYDG